MLQKKQQQRTTGTSFIKTCNKNLTLNHDKHKRTSFNITQMTNNLKSTIHGMNNWPIKNPVKIQTKFTKRKWPKSLQNCKRNEKWFQTTRKDKLKTNVSSPKDFFKKKYTKSKPWKIPKATKKHFFMNYKIVKKEWNIHQSPLTPRWCFCEFGFLFCPRLPFGCLFF